MRVAIVFRLLLVLVVLLVLDFRDTLLSVGGEPQGWQVDVYTQKQPYNGAGLGEVSDSFAPQQTVALYANVTYNTAPVQNIPVSFSVRGPPNPVSNYTFSLSAFTNAFGVAERNFTIPFPARHLEASTFGLWNVTAYIKNASDSLLFRVGWIIDIISLYVIDEDPPQGGFLDVQLSLMNIAMTSRNATLALTSTDSTGGIISTFVVENVEIEVGVSNLSVRVSIPLWSNVGTATLEASVYTSGGDPFSPTTLSATFMISLLGDLNGDNQVNMLDLGIGALAFGSYRGHLRWNSLADLNKDDEVNMMDIALISSNFGNTYP